MAESKIPYTDYKFMEYIQVSGSSDGNNYNVTLNIKHLAVRWTLLILRASQNSVLVPIYAMVDTNNQPATMMFSDSNAASYDPSTGLLNVKCGTGAWGSITLVFPKGYIKKQ